MTTADAIAFLADKDNEPDELRSHFARRASYLNALFAALDAADKRAKNRAAKLIARFAETDPEAGAKRLDTLLQLANADDTIVLWNALLAIGHLAGEADESQLKPLLPRLRKLLADESMVTAGHAVRCFGRIAAADPKLTAGIVRDLLKVDEVPRDASCAAILAGKVIAAFEEIQAGEQTPTARLSASMRAFAQAHTESPRNSTARAAERFLRRHG